MAIGCRYPAVFCLFIHSKKCGMKTYIVMLLALTGTIFSCLSAKNIQETNLFDKRAKDTVGNDMLLGKCPRSALLEKPYSDWFQKNYEDYKVDETLLNFLTQLLQNKRITIFLGTWCGDSKREVPRMLKILDAAKFDNDQLQLIMVSNQAGMYKQSPQHEEAGKNIIRVPTLIIYGNEKEIGRIVEYPVQSLEKDLVSIMKGSGYVPNYSPKN
jgi:hypothetical protein